tara:strand:- start:675 stop:1265 length:591 start_codon:yes stop_codon:yes gene_type:complete
MNKDIGKTFIGTTKREEFNEFEDLYKGVEAFMGYLPNAHLTMSESPGLLLAFSQLATIIFQSNSLDIQTKQLIALASSLSAGCKYCQAHTSHGAERVGVDEKKIAQILNYTDSKEYTKKEKAALDLAFAAGKVPNMSTKKHFDNLTEYYSKKEIVEIVAVISLFGFLNRWNDTLGTALEEVPESFVNERLKPLGWI